MKQAYEALTPSVRRRREMWDRKDNIDISAANYPKGAEGCGKCHYGLLGDTRIDGTAPLYVLRMRQAEAKQIRFCSCSAGACYRSYLLRAYQREKDLPVAMQAVDKWLEEGKEAA